jgi:hypothetical protein
MTGSTRVTITLPSEILSEIDREEKNRSRFILEAVQREIVRRRKEALATSLDHPHPESQSLEASDLTEWFGTGEGDASRLLDSDAGMDIQWIPDEGWVTVEK